jgi:hypothetical protein
MRQNNQIKDNPPPPQTQLDATRIIPAPHCDWSLIIINYYWKNKETIRHEENWKTDENVKSPSVKNVIQPTTESKQ